MPDVSLMREAAVLAADPATRTLTMQLLRWMDPRPVSDPGRPPYVEQWAPGSLTPLERLYVVDRHGGELIGRMTPPYDNGVGPVSELTIAHTRAGDDLLALVDAGVVGAGSIEALAAPHGELWSPDRRAVTRTAATLAGVAFAFHPAHDSALLARQRSTAMPTPATTPPPPPPPPGSSSGDAGADDVLEGIARSLESFDSNGAGERGDAGDNGRDTGRAPTPPATPPPPPVPHASGAGAGAGGGDAADRIARAIDARMSQTNGDQSRSVDELQSQVVVMRSALLTLVDRARRPAGYRYNSLAEIMLANARGEMAAADMVALNRALVDVTTGDIPGLIPRPALAQILDIIQRNQVTVDAMGTAPLPDSGMTVDYPHVTARPTVAIQTAEKTDVASAKTHVARESADVITLAGGEDVSLQAILRSSPSYLQLMGELYLEAMAIATNAYGIAQYTEALALAPADHRVSIGVDPALWVGKLFGLAGEVLTDRRALPNRLVLSTDLWVKIGGATDSEGRPIFTNTNPQNPAGTASLTSTSGDVRTLGFEVDPQLPLDRGLMFDSQAIRAALGPVSTLTADVPARLGRDYAIYRFGTILPIDPLGLAAFATGTAPVAEEAEGSSSRSRTRK